MTQVGALLTFWAQRQSASVGVGLHQGSPLVSSLDLEAQLGSRGGEFNPPSLNMDGLL